MGLSWDDAVTRLQKHAPLGSPRRKLLQLVAIILFFEGISVLILFSYMGVALGVASIVIGALLLVILAPGPSERGKEETEPPPGIKLIDKFVDVVGGPAVMMVLGVLIVAVVLLFNLAISDRPEIGDLDTLTILFGLVLMFYPYMAVAYKTEAAFALLFIGVVVILLVIPQAIASMLPEDGGSSVGNLYVRYMLAAPFAGLLSLIGIPAESTGNMVTIEFQDGTLQTLGISAYCAGLYSFSIFLAAFISFVLVFERLPRRPLVIVLAAGLFVAYLGNLIRMVIIGIVGYFYGLQALLWAHENVGWMIFLSWSAIFWYLLLGYASKHTAASGHGGDGN